MGKGEQKKNSEHTATVHKEAHGEGHATSPMDLFKVDPGLVLWTWITFILLFLILRKFAWKPLQETVKKRETEIADSIANAEKLKVSLKEIEEKQQSVLAQAKKQGQEIITEAREKAELVAKEIEQKAQNTAEEIVANARKQMEAEREKAASELKNEAVEIIIQASSMLIEKNLDEKKHKSLARHYIEELS